MKALTIQQPWAHLIALPDGDPLAKRVENRSWYTEYRGPLVIHAGKSRARLAANPYPPALSPAFAFGAVVAVASLVGCVPLARDLETREPAFPGWALDRWPWLARHPWLEGPYCWVLERVQPLEPIVCPGRQGLWELPAAVHAAVMRAAFPETYHEAATW